MNLPKPKEVLTPKQTRKGGTVNNETIEWLKSPTWYFPDRGCVRLRNFIDEYFDDKPIYEILFFNIRNKPKNFGPLTINVLEDEFKKHDVDLYKYWIKGQASDAERIRTQKNKDKLKEFLGIN